MKINKLIVILGPTASGKTDLAIKLARRFNGEIVCADSRQIYREMTIGTASPNLRGAIPCKAYGGSSPVFLKGILHHLFHIISPKKTFSAAQYQKLAEKTIKDIQKRGKIPFLVGGTAFYIYSIVEGWQFLADFSKTVTFFGSARFKEGDKWYEEARRLGTMLAKHGLAVVTGGGPGIMEAGNRGAVEGHGESVGINIQLPMEQRINPYVQKSAGFHYFFIRKLMLAYAARAYVFFPG